ncbi:MAG: nicotinate-nucleotide--dimethylbenzimidazole phosphoribosyltransferase [Burkholderiales bacterium 28-67-8]|nr:MAG: nicotinate-nucleotide--dimethylbenzimidazole phosphoribosyltransferase [Burkholderiales bacterium 28-67-8]
MSSYQHLISPTANALLEVALREKLLRRSHTTGELGELEPLAVRLGLIQNTLKPAFSAPQVIVFAADHGIAVDGIGASARHSTHQLVRALLASQMPLSVFAHIQQLELSVVDAGIAETANPHPRLLSRKIAHGTRSSRLTLAMSLEQAHGAIRAGMEIGDALPGNAVLCAGIGVGSDYAAAMMLSRLAGVPIREFMPHGSGARAHGVDAVIPILLGAMARHKEVNDPVEVLAALGGFEIAMLVGLMLVASGKRHLVMVDGLAACAALAVSSRISPAVVDYCVFCRSHSHPGLDRALRLFQASSLLELGMDSIDGTGSTLAWPLVRSAAALLTEVAEGEDPGPSRPGELSTVTSADGPANRSMSASAS